MEAQEEPRNQLLRVSLVLDAFIDIVTDTKIKMIQLLPPNKSQFNQRISHFNKKDYDLWQKQYKVLWVSKERNRTSDLETSKGFTEEMVVEIGLRMMYSFHS